MTALEYLEICTIVLGILSASAAFSMSIYFARTSAGIGKAVALDKFAEGINMLVILTFAIVYFTDVFQKMPVLWAASLRILAILATLGSSLHLAYQTRQVIVNDADKES